MIRSVCLLPQLLQLIGSQQLVLSFFTVRGALQLKVNRKVLVLRKEVVIVKGQKQ